jgi:hypothetical protein
MIEIRQADAADGDALGEIHAAAWEVAYAPFFSADFAARDRRTRWHGLIAGSRLPVLFGNCTLDHLWGNGFGRVHLWTLRDTPRSPRFYTKCGFAETGATTTRDFGDGNPLAQVEYERLTPGG